MNISKRIIAIVLCVMMIVPGMSFAASADEAVSGWTPIAAKFSSTSGKVIMDPANTGKTKMDGFTFTENEDGGIDVHSPSFEEVAGAYGIAGIASDKPVTLDNLSVVIQPGETFTATRDLLGYAARISMMWSDTPITAVSDGTNGITDALTVQTNGIRYLIPATGKGVSVGVGNTNAKYTEGQVVSDVFIFVYDGEYSDPDDEYPGYRWVRSGRNTTGAPDASGIVLKYPRVDVSCGLVFEFVPDTTLGYRIYVNGNDCSKGDSIAYFPGGTDSDFTKEKADIDLSNFEGELGYLTIASNAAQKTGVDYTVEMINGYPAATWNGQEADVDHEHDFYTIKVDETCTEDGVTFQMCECGQHFISENIAAKGHDWALNSRKYRDVAYTAYDKFWDFGYANKEGKFYAFYDQQTCTEAGSAHRICTECGATDELELPALNHGSIYTRQGDWDVENPLFFDSRRWGDWVITTPATATTDGVKTRTCFLCGETETMTYKKTDDVEEILDKWYVSGEKGKTLSDGKTKTTTVVEDGNRVQTTVNEDGSITLKDEANLAGVVTAANSNNNITKITSKATSDLNGFTATVQLLPVKNAAGNDVYPDSVGFVWTTEFDNYCYASQYSNGSFAIIDTRQSAASRYGHAWNYYTPDTEYTVFLTVADGYGTINGSDLGTPGDGVYDVVLYGAVCRGDFWAAKFATTATDTADYHTKKVAFDPAEPITVESYYGYDEDDDAPDVLYFAVNGFLFYFPEVVASQVYEPVYHFGVAATSPEAGHAASGFTLVEVCGVAPTEFEGYDGDDCIDGEKHEWGEWKWDTKRIVDPEKSTETKKVYKTVECIPNCHDKGYKISECENCGCTRKQRIDSTEHPYHVKTLFEATCTTPGLIEYSCGLHYWTDDGEEAYCGGKKYELVPTTGHVWEEEIIKEATCTEDGLVNRVCEECGEVEDEAVIPATGHTWGEDEERVEATCTTDGSVTHTCTVCNETVTETIKATGHEWSEWVKDEKGENETRTCSVCGATETRKVEVPVENNYTDLPDGTWYTDACLWCAGKTYMSGTSATTFAPNMTLTRAQFVQIMAKVEGVDLNSVEYKAVFTDVAENQWYTKAVIWAVDFGVTGGMGNGIFAPNAPVSRQQLAVFLRTYAQKKNIDTTDKADLSGYADEASIAAWAKDALGWAVKATLISGTDATHISPLTTATRAQVAVIIKKFCENVIK